jgi:uncharacterized membrane protein YbaN (DUF454 family)
LREPSFEGLQSDACDVTLPSSMFVVVKVLLLVSRDEKIFLEWILPENPLSGMVGAWKSVHCVPETPAWQRELCSEGDAV